MQLVRLTIERNDSIIRDIPFEDGINIITNSGTDGNQVGKSTALRAINFCLGSDGTDLWKDPDSKIENPEIKRFITSGNVTFKLYLNVRGREFLIQRRIEEQRQKKRIVYKKLSWINGEEVNGQKSFRQEMAKIFGHYANKPSYSTIKKRLIKLDKATANQLYRYLNFGTSDHEYLEIYSYLFGFAGHNDLSEVIRLEKAIKEQETRVSILLNGKTEQQYKDLLESINDELEILNQKEDNFDFKGIQAEAIENLRLIRVQIAKISSTIGNLETRSLYAERTIRNYKSQMTNIDTSLIESIYKEAQSLIPNLSKSLEETISFHNSILEKKLGFVEQQLVSLTHDIASKNENLNYYLDEEKSLIKAISNETHLGGFIIVEKALQEKREERGRVRFVLDEVSVANKSIQEKNREITTLRLRNQQHMSQLMKNIEGFNVESKKLTRALFQDFGISLNASCDSDSGALNFSIINDDKISGDGSPRAAVLAFDMAFVKYIKKTGAKLPEFTIQDYLEAADEDKLATLAALANEQNIQVIISILSDKLNSLTEEFRNDNIILELSPSDKFFKV